MLQCSDTTWWCAVRWSNLQLMQVVPCCCQLKSKLRSQFLGPLCLWQCLVDFSFPFSCVFPVSWFLVVRIDRRLFKTVFMPGSRIGNADIARRRPFHKLSTILLIINVLLHAGIEKMLIEYTLTVPNLFFKKKLPFNTNILNRTGSGENMARKLRKLNLSRRHVFSCLYCRPDLVEEAVLAIYVIFSQRKHTSCCQTERNG